MVAAAVQAAYVLMDRESTLDKAVGLVREASAEGARLVVLPEAFLPGTPIWIDSNVVWENDERWYTMLLDQAVVVPSQTTERLGAAARDAGAYFVVGVDEREPHGTTIYNTILYFGPDGSLLGKHRKLMPTGSERTVWGMGDGSTLGVYETPFGRLGGLICWENYMPLTRFYMYSLGVDVWVAPTLATGGGWTATLRHIALEGSMWVIGVNPCVHVEQIPADFPDRDLVWRADRDGEWVEPGNSAIVDPRGEFVAGPATNEDTILFAEIDVNKGRARRRKFDPVGHYNRPDVFRLSIDLGARPAVHTFDGSDESRPETENV
jgi:nitrilase